MIRLDDNIRYQNVIAYRMVFPYLEMKKELDDFNAKVDKLGIQKVGPLCYILHSFSQDDKIDVEFLMPLKEAVIPCDEELLFHTYYAVENMVSSIVFDDYDKKMEMTYSALIEFVKAAGMEIATPFYHIVDRHQRYLKVMLGYRPL